MKTFRFWTLALLAAILLCSAFSVPAQAGTLTITLDKNTPKCTAGTLCTATDVTSGEGFWTFAVTVTGKVNSLGLQIKDSFPGASDFCYSSSVKNPRGTFPVTTPMMIPAAATDACGTQWVDTNGPPFSFVAYIQTSDPKANVVITVTYPDPVVVLNGIAFKESGSRAADTLQDQGIVEGKERYGKPSRA